MDKYYQIIDRENELLRKKLKAIDRRFYRVNAFLVLSGCICTLAIIYVSEILLFLNKYIL